MSKTNRPEAGKAREDNYYTLLEIDNKCTQSDIDSAYRRLAVRWHPDKNKDNKEAAEKKFREISKAYQVLSDETSRSNYDKYGVVSSSGESNGNNDNLFDPYEMFKGMFETEENQIPDVIITIDANITQLYTGFTKTVKFTRFSECNKCESTGTRNKKSADCVNCTGRGILMETVKGGKMGYMINEKVCGVCEGKGIDPEVKLCKKCTGDKYIKEDIECEVDVPPGAYDNYYIKLEEEGNYIPEEDRKSKTAKTTKTRTDVIVVIKEHESKQPTETMFRRGMFIQEINRINLADILLTVNISFGESIVGVKKEIEFLAGETIGIDIDEIIHNGDIHVIKGMGMPLVPEELDKLKSVQIKSNKLTSTKGKIKFQTRGDLFLYFKVDKPILSKQKRNRLWQIITDTPYPDEIDIDDIKQSTLSLESYINEHKCNKNSQTKRNNNSSDLSNSSDSSDSSIEETTHSSYSDDTDNSESKSESESSSNDNDTNTKNKHYKSSNNKSSNNR